MAAGYGTRMEPLTIAVPKPMVPIVNKPTMHHNIELLKAYGFTHLTANIHYHPEQIENYFGDGRLYDVDLSYSYEEKLLGTAGGVKRMAVDFAEIDGTFLVISSDALTDINLDKIFEYHKKKQAMITIALAPVKDITEFGVVVTDADDRVIGFQEKPKKEEAKSNLVNTGIYVFEPEVLDLIPEGFCDFGKQLFPLLVKKKAPLFGYRMVEYWSDVGGLEKYIASNYDAIKGTVRINIPGRRTASGIWLGERQKIDKTARFEGSVIIGDRCEIGKDVYIKDSIIGDKCIIEDHAVIQGSVIWSDTIVESRAQVEHSVIGNWCHIGEKARLSKGSVIANRSVVRDNTEVPAGTRLQPNSLA